MREPPSGIDFRRLFEATPGPYLILAPDFTIVAVNDAYLAATLTRREDLIGRRLFDAFPDNPDDPAADGVANLRASLERVLLYRRADFMAVQKYDIHKPESEGGGFEARYWSPTNVPVFDAAGDVRWIIHHVADTTRFMKLAEADEQTRELARHQQATIAHLREANAALAAQIETSLRLRAEQAATADALKAEEARFQAVADRIPGIVYRGVTTPDGRYAEPYVSGGLERHLGVAAEHIMSGKSVIMNYIHPDDRADKIAAFTRAGLNLEPVVTELRMVRPDGDLRWWRLHTKPTRVGDAIQWDGIALDITAAKLTEQQLHQAVKMEAIGQLTGGVAHDFNNLLTVILGSTETLIEALGGDQRLRVLAELTQTAASRGAELTSQLLAFSRRQALEPRPIDVNKLVARVDGMIRRVVRSDIGIELVRGAGLWSAMADPAQLESALLNLVVNARDAMPSGGKLTIETANTHLDNTYVTAEFGLTPGEYVVLCVTDTGAGMSPDVQARAFEPFYTTKPIGQGTGLGLSQLYGFARQSGGHAAIYSEEGKGTTVKLYLPRHHEAVQAEPVVPALPEPEPAQEGETILVLEDEGLVRMLLVQTLERQGYRVIEAHEPQVALDALETEPKIDLLATDVGLPGMNGRQVAEIARRLKPEIAVLFLTGYAHNAALGDEPLSPRTQVLSKPFNARALLTKISAMLESGG